MVHSGSCYLPHMENSHITHTFFLAISLHFNVLIKISHNALENNVQHISYNNLQDQSNTPGDTDISFSGHLNLVSTTNVHEQRVVSLFVDENQLGLSGHSVTMVCVKHTVKTAHTNCCLTGAKWSDTQLFWCLCKVCTYRTTNQVFLQSGYVFLLFAACMVEYLLTFCISGLCKDHWWRTNIHKKQEQH